MEHYNSYNWLFNSYINSFYSHDLRNRFVTQPVSGEKGDDGFGIDNAVPGTDGKNQAQLFGDKPKNEKQNIESIYKIW